jgi:hypothetical protein
MIKYKDLKELMDRYEYLAKTFDYYDNLVIMRAADPCIKAFVDGHTEEFKHLKDKLSKVCDLT